jgi:hypothetical protein
MKVHNASSKCKFKVQVQNTITDANAVTNSKSKCKPYFKRKWLVKLKTQKHKRQFKRTSKSNRKSQTQTQSINGNKI